MTAAHYCASNAAASAAAMMSSRDGWKLMDEVTNGGLPIDNKKTKEYTIANQGTYQYYRFEVSKNTGSTHVQLDGFDFVY